MSGWYEVEPFTITLHTSAEADRLVEALRDLEGDDTDIVNSGVCPDTGFAVEVAFQVSQEESAGGPSTWREAFDALAPHVAWGFQVKGRFDNQEFSYWVGAEPAVAFGKSVSSFQTCVDHMQLLSPHHLAELIRLANQRRFQLTLEGEAIT